jgi:hypothetical protein
VLDGFLSLDTSLQQHEETKIPDLIQKLRKFSNPEVKEILKEIDKFGEFCEVLSIQSPRDVQRGAIYQGDTNDKILICISQSCDCLRKSPLLFIEGTEMKKQRSSQVGETGILAGGKPYLFKASAENLKTIVIQTENQQRNPENKTLLGYLRKDILERLAARFLRYATRVGVNQPLLMRKYRDEEPY